MKIRSGFVSNSSSSSFLLVGFKDKELWKIIDQLGLSGISNIDDWEEREELFRTAGFTDYGYGTFISKNRLVIVMDYDGISCIGIEAEQLLNDGNNVKEIGKTVVQKLKEISLNTDIDSDNARVLSGTSSSEW